MGRSRSSPACKTLKASTMPGAVRSARSQCESILKGKRRGREDHVLVLIIIIIILCVASARRDGVAHGRAQNLKAAFSQAQRRFQATGHGTTSTSRPFR